MGISVFFSPLCTCTEYCSKHHFARTNSTRGHTITPMMRFDAIKESRASRARLLLLRTLGSGSVKEFDQGSGGEKEAKK